MSSFFLSQAKSNFKVSSLSFRDYWNLQLSCVNAILQKVGKKKVDK